MKTEREGESSAGRYANANHKKNEGGGDFWVEPRPRVTSGGGVFPGTTETTDADGWRRWKMLKRDANFSGVLNSSSWLLLQP